MNNGSIPTFRNPHNRLGPRPAPPGGRIPSEPTRQDLAPALGSEPESDVGEMVAGEPRHDVGAPAAKPRRKRGQ